MEKECFLEFFQGDRAEWDRLAGAFPGFSLTQSWAFGEAKAATGPWRVERAIFRRDGVIEGAAQVMARALPFGLGGLCWINRGPLGRTGDPGAHLALLRRHYADKRRFYLRVAPPEGASPPACDGFVPTGVLGWASARVDLAREPEDIRAALKGRWRNYLGRAERSGAVVKDGATPADISLFIESYRHFLEGRGFTTSVSPGLIAALRDASDETALRVLVAEHDGRVQGTLLLVLHGDTAEFLAGDTSDKDSPARVSRLLFWRAIEYARAAGCRWFDVGGLDPARTPPGIVQFKEGLGGEGYRLPEEIEALPPGFAGLSARLIRIRIGHARGE